MKPTRFSFGATSAITTNLAIIIGLDTISNARVSIIGALLVIAVADNISDTLGIHIYKESETADAKEIYFTTFINYLARLLVSLIFILFIILFPLNTAVYLSIIYGLLVLTAISYIIAKQRHVNPLRSISQHLAIAIGVIVASNYLGKLIPH